MNKFIQFLLLVSCCNTLDAQTDSTFTYQIGFKGTYGFVIAHSPVMEYIADQHISGFQLSIDKQTFGEKLWHQRHQFPRVGLSFSYFQLNQEYLGNAYSLAPHLNFSLFGNTAVRLRLKTAIGIGMIEKIFDPEGNFKNSAIGSKFNLFFTITAETEVQISKQSGILLGASFSHFSNTAFKKPNLGINIPAAEIGIFHKIGKPKQKIYKKEDQYKREPSSWMLSVGFGTNDISPTDDKLYFASGLSIAKEKQLNYKSSIGGGMDLFYNPAQIEVLKANSVIVKKGWQNLRIGASIYHVLHFGKFENYVQAGYYLKTKDKEVGNFYQVVGGRYAINSQWKALLGLKTHFAKAEYLLFGLAYKIGGAGE